MFNLNVLIGFILLQVCCSYGNLDSLLEKIERQAEAEPPVKITVKELETIVRQAGAPPDQATFDTTIIVSSKGIRIDRLCTSNSKELEYPKVERSVYSHDFVKVLKFPKNETFSKTAEIEHGRAWAGLFANYVSSSQLKTWLHSRKNLQLTSSSPDGAIVFASSTVGSPGMFASVTLKDDDHVFLKRVDYSSGGQIYQSDFGDDWTVQAGRKLPTQVISKKPGNPSITTTYRIKRIQSITDNEATDALNLVFPEKTLVQDFRVNPPVTYRQGTNDVTPEQLIKLSIEQRKEEEGVNATSTFEF